MCVWCSLWMIVCMFTVSKALLRSSDTTIVRSGGWGLLKPCVIWFVSWCRAVEVGLETVLVRVCLDVVGDVWQNNFFHDLSDW